MKRRLAIVVAFGAAAVCAAASAQPRAPGPGDPSHPREVALVKEGAKGSVYRKFPSGLRLYTSDRDPPGKSLCLDGCAAAWPPVLAPPRAKAVGEWTVVRRRDGQRQWALRGKPVYTRFHDAPDQPTGDGLEGSWRLVQHRAEP